MFNATYTTPARQHAAARVHPHAAAAALMRGEAVTIGRVQLVALVEDAAARLHLTLAGRSGAYTLDELEAELETLHSA